MTITAWKRWFTRGTPTTSTPDPPVKLPVHLGPTDLWWIRKPRRARMSMRTALLGWIVLAILVGITWARLSASGLDVWPFNRPVGSPPPARLQQVFKYELIFAVFWLYGTLRSVLVWIRYWRLTSDDTARIDPLIAQKKWKHAAERIHRYELLRRTLIRKPTQRLAEWDDQVRPHLPSSKRLYIYYRRRPPQIPDGPTHAFTPEVVPLSQPKAMTLIGLIPMIAAMWLLVMTILADTSNWYRLLSFNSLVMITLLLGYGILYVCWILGRSKYLRLAPQTAQLIKYRTLSRTPAIETFDLHTHHAVLDLTGLAPALTLIRRTDQRHMRTFYLPGGAKHIPACLRAILSTADQPPLDAHELVG